MKTLIFLPIFVLFTWSCSQNQQNQSPNQGMTIPKPKLDTPKVSTDPHPQWQDFEEPLKEMLSAPIGKYLCPFGKYVTTDIGGVVRQLPCNCATIAGVDAVIVDDTASYFLGSYSPVSQAIWFNRYRAKKSYDDAIYLLKESNLLSSLDSITYEKFANGYLQQEWWHSQGHTGPDVEFFSDVVSIKILGEWFLCTSLLNLVQYYNGGEMPNTYKQQMETYYSLLKELGVKLDELTCLSPPENYGDTVIRILRNHPQLLTRLKEMILQRY